MADFTEENWSLGVKADAVAEGGQALGDNWADVLFESLLNRVWDTSVSRFVYWLSYSVPDPNGTLYPGPGVYGVDTVGYTFISPHNNLQI